MAQKLYRPKKFCPNIFFLWNFFYRQLPHKIVKTPTQPQHNLTQPEVGFDTIIAVHHHPTHHQELYFY